MSYSFNHKTNHMHGSNISVVIQFKCDRCGRCHYEDPDEQEDAEHNIQCYKPPYGWEFKRGGYLFCTECSMEYDEMMDKFLWGGKHGD